MRKIGLFSRFSDHFIIFSLLSKLDCFTLNILLSVCKYFHILAQNEELFKSMVLEKHTKFAFKGSWRVTFHYPVSMPSPAAFRSISRILKYPSLWQCSEYLYDFWYISNISLKGISIIDSIDHPDFISSESSESISPYILSKQAAGISKWRAFSDWSESNLAELYGSTKFQIHAAMGQDIIKLEMTLIDYFQYCRNQHDQTPLYIFDDKFYIHAPSLLNDYNIPSIYTHDLFKNVLNRPPFKWLIIGPAKSGASWHVDPLMTSAWNTLVFGKKLWFFFPPNTHVVGYEMTSLQWFLLVFPRLGYKPLQVIQNVGDTIYVPSGWIHSVLNLDDYNVSITQNFASPSNIENVLLELIRIDAYDQYISLKNTLFDLEDVFSRIEDSLVILKDPIITEHKCLSKEAFLESIYSREKWQEHLAALSKMHPDLLNFRAIIGNHQTPVFETESFVVKIYLHLHGLSSFISEIVSYKLFKDTNLLLKMSRYGFLDIGKIWRYPYIVIEKITSNKLISFSSIEFQNWCEMMIETIHSVNIHDIPKELIKDLKIHNFRKLVQDRIDSSILKLVEWDIVPKELMSKIPEYIDSFVPKLDTLVRYLHGDLNETNFMRNEYGFKIIDFADAYYFDEFGCDPVFEFVCLYTSVFWYDRDAFRAGFKRFFDESFYKRLLVYVLLWEYSGPLLVISKMKGFQDCKDWFEVEELLKR